MQGMLQRAYTCEKPKPEVIVPGITLDSIKPGGWKGPNNEVLWETPGGQVWNDNWVLGTDKDAFKLSIPDIRMPPNQFWPLHWHDCWIAVVVLDGTCLIGDWWMKPGDVLISRAELEYGPVLVGPAGCQLFEIFARQHLALGGYAPEYHDHPTLSMGIPFVFKERAPENRRNAGNQVLPNAGVNGLITGHLKPGAQWDIGEANDPERGIMCYTGLKAGEFVAPHSYDDDRAIFVLQGEMKLGERNLITKDAIMIERNTPVPAFQAGPEGAQLLEVTRTAKGLKRNFT